MELQNSNVLKLMKSKTFQTIWTAIISTFLLQNESQTNGLVYIFTQINELKQKDEITQVNVMQ